MQPYEDPRDADRADFSEPYQIDPETDSPVIYLNKKELSMLAGKQREYEQRIAKHPNHLDSRIKYTVVSQLREKGFVTLDDVIATFGEEAEEDPEGITRSITNAFIVIGSYNSGNKELLQNIVQPAKQVEEQRGKERNMLRNILRGNTPSVLSDNELAIGRYLQSQLNYAMAPINSRKEIYVLLDEYRLEKNFSSFEQAIANLIRKRPVGVANMGEVLQQFVRENEGK